MASISTGEMEVILQWFRKDNITRPDGSWVEFFLDFYELIGTYMLKVIEECRTSWRTYEALNSTFIALIPKSNAPRNFKDYKTISLCNYIYKIIAKNITNKIKPILS